MGYAFRCGQSRKKSRNVGKYSGREAFEKLSDDEKRFLRLFIWAGCGCHTDLNTVHGGYMAMASWWKENDLEEPVLLANRDNDPVIQERNTAITEGDTPTPAQE